MSDGGVGDEVVDIVVVVDLSSGMRVCLNRVPAYVAKTVTVEEPNAKPMSAKKADPSYYFSCCSANQ